MSAVEPALVEVRAEYLNVFKTMVRVDLEVWDEAERRVYEGQILSVSDNRVILTFIPEGNQALTSEKGHPATICYTVKGDLYRGDCRILAVDRLKIIKVTASRPTEVSRSQLRSSIRWGTKLEQCTLHRADRSDPSSWESYPFIVSNVSSGGFGGQTVMNVPTGSDARDLLYTIEIAFPWNFGTVTLPATLLGSDPTVVDGRPGFRYRARFIDAPAEAQDTIIRYINRSQIELRLRGNTGPPGPIDPVSDPSVDIDQRMRIARRDFPELAVGVNSAAATTEVAEPPAVDTPPAPVESPAPDPTQLEPEVAEHQRHITARAHRLGAKATEVARDIVSSSEPHRVRQALPFVRGLLTELGDPDMFQAFARALDTDAELYTHSINVSVYAMALGAQRRYSEEQMVELATGAFLHDIGMTVISDEIVKKRGPLTPQEWVIIRRHPHEGRAIASATRAFSSVVLDIIEHHQERFDGGGYPDGLRGDAIPEGARIVAIADAFDALTVDKPYRTAYSLFKALTVVRDEMATGFDRLLLRDFIFSLGQILGSSGR